MLGERDIYRMKEREREGERKKEREITKEGRNEPDSMKSGTRVRMLMALNLIDFGT